MHKAFFVLEDACKSPWQNYNIRHDKDHTDPQMCTTYVEDIYEYLRNAEVWIVYISPVSLKHSRIQINPCIVMHILYRSS